MRTYNIEFFWYSVCPLPGSRPAGLPKCRPRQVPGRLAVYLAASPQQQKEYAMEFPPNYERGHTAGLRMLRVAAKRRAALVREHGSPHEGYGRADRGSAQRVGDDPEVGTVAHIEEVLQAIGLPAAFATAAMTPGWDAELDAETALALSRRGDVGTPSSRLRPPWGVLFWPVISPFPLMRKLSRWGTPCSRWHNSLASPNEV